MALNNRERITRAFDLLQEGLHDLVDEVMTRYFHRTHSVTAGSAAGWRKPTHRYNCGRSLSTVGSSAGNCPGDSKA